MKRAGYLTERIADTDNLLLAYYKASRGKRMKEESRCFSDSLDKEVGPFGSANIFVNVDVVD